MSEALTVTRPLLAPNSIDIPEHASSQSLEQAHETLHFFCDDRDTLPPSHASSSRPQLAHLRVRFIGLNSIFEGRPTNSCIDHISPMLTPLGLLLAFTASIHALDTLTITSLLTTIPSGYTTTNLTTTFALSPITLTSALAPITCSTSFLPTKAPTSFLPCSNPAYAFRFTDPAATACGFEMEIAVTVPLATTGSGTGETVTLAKVLADQEDSNATPPREAMLLKAALLPMLMSESRTVTNIEMTMELSGMSQPFGTWETQAENGEPWSLAKEKSCLDADAMMVMQENVAMIMTIAVIALVAAREPVEL
ncbi:hypothetical protein M8818_003188 [Zalaria obscura]|uniref:Uncharacterized protein n=1 Tax=Zalaria obscura TaxID=2024903 RepID=A0ACC3SH74_9PEZI